MKLSKRTLRALQRKRTLGYRVLDRLIWLGIVFFAAAFAPWLPFKDPDATSSNAGETTPVRAVNDAPIWY